MSRLPAFIVIGAQKAGTTALRYALAQQPQIYLPAFPEPAFFAFDGGAPAFAGPQSPTSRFGLIPTLEEYAALYTGAGTGQLLGDVSSHYSYCWPERTAACMHRNVPDARIIAILRQPADRAYSAFNMMRQKGLEPLTDFAAALAAEDAPARANWTPDFFYRRNGLYHTNLAPYYRLFGAQQIRVFRYEEWTAQPVAVLAEMFRFFGLHGAPIFDPTARYRESALPRSAAALRGVRHLRGAAVPGWLRKWLRAWLWVRPAPLAPAVRSALTASYQAEIERLQDLIQQDLGDWLA